MKPLPKSFECKNHQQRGDKKRTERGKGNAAAKKWGFGRDFNLPFPAGVLLLQEAFRPLELGNAEGKQRGERLRVEISEKEK